MQLEPDATPCSQPAQWTVPPPVCDRVWTVAVSAAASSDPGQSTSFGAPSTLPGATADDTPIGGDAGLI
jgi:hypothetical protein